jgi:hypothetical protein
MEQAFNIRSEQDQLIDQIAAVLCAPTFEAPMSAPVVSDIGNILLQLSEAVAEAKGEAERERMKRFALEKENSEMRSKQLLFVETSSSLEDDSNVYGCRTFNPLAGASSGSVVDTFLNLHDCLSFVSSLANPNLIYMSYQKAGFAALDLTRVERILQPHDFSSLMIIVFSSPNTFIPPELLPFRLDTLQALLSSPVGSSVTASYSPKNSSSTFEDPPRMNLLEALNVQCDSDCKRIVTVRKCHKLGFKSHIYLRQYFSKFGKVERVVLLPMRAKPKNSMDGRGNRPSSMGFVVMESQEMVDSIITFNQSCGIHEVKGWPIEVRNFVKPVDKSGSWSGPVHSGDKSEEEPGVFEW